MSKRIWTDHDCHFCGASRVLRSELIWCYISNSGKSIMLHPSSEDHLLGNTSWDKNDIELKNRTFHAGGRLYSQPLLLAHRLQQREGSSHLLRGTMCYYMCFYTWYTLVAIHEPNIGHLFAYSRHVITVYHVLSRKLSFLGFVLPSSKAVTPTDTVRSCACVPGTPGAL